MRKTEKTKQKQKQQNNNKTKKKSPPPPKTLAHMAHQNHTCVKSRNEGNTY